MSTTIDSKVVEMRFDNRQFEQNVSQTMSSIEKLNKSLEFKGTTKGFEGIDAASQQTGKSLENLEYTSYKAGFRWSDVLAKISSTAEWRMAQGAVAGLERTVKSLADQMFGLTSAKAGFDEYGLKMGSVQTIMASTGEDLETVNGYLEELNAYSDKTIYSFSDMTQNIGKFTNAGVKLKDSVAAIQGIANVAALSGANSNEASRAMYNFSQALSSGYVKLIDWKSIENANMATVGFKEQLIDTAVQLGTVTKQADGTYKTLAGNTFTATKGFNEVFQDQWMTSEVLTKTLANYADETTEIGAKATQAATEVKTFSQMMDTLKESAQSGWAQTWELIFGNFEEGKSLWTDLSERFGGIISASAEMRNELLEDWKALGGRDDLIASLTNVFDAIGSIVKPIKEAFSEIFPPATAKSLLAFTTNLRKFTEGLKLSDKASDNLRRTFRGLFAVVDIVFDIFSALFGAIGSVFGATGELSGGVLGIAAAFGDALVGIRDFIVDTRIFHRAFGLVANIIKIGVKIIGKIASAVETAFNSGPLDSFVNILGGAISAFSELLGATGNFGDGIADTFGRIGEALQNSLLFKILNSIWKLIKTIATAVGSALSSAFSKIVGIFSGGDFSLSLDSLVTLLDGGVLVGIGILVKKIIDFFNNIGDLGDGLLEKFDDMIAPFKNIFTQLGDCIQSFTESIKAHALKTIATAILMLAIALIALSFIDEQKLSNALVTIALAFGEMMLAIKLISGTKNMGDTAKLIKSLTSLSLALLLMCATVAILGNMNTSELIQGVLAVCGLIIAIGLAQKLGSKIDGSTSAFKGVFSMALGLLALCATIKILGTMKMNELIQGVIGAITLIGAIAVAQAVGSRLPGSTSAFKGVFSMALALVLLCIPIKILGDMDTNKLLQGVLAVCGIIGAIGTAQLLGSKMKGSTSAFKGVIIMALAILALCVPLKIIAGMKLDAMIQGVSGVCALLVSLGLAQFLISKFANNVGEVLKGALALAIMAASILLLTPTLLALGSMSIGQVVSAVGGLVVTLAALVGAVALLALIGKNIGGAIKGALAITILSAALFTLVPTLGLLAAIGFVPLAIGLGLLAASFLVLAGVVLVLSPVVGILGLFAGALLKIGLAVLTASAGMFLFGLALSAIAAGLIALVAAFAVVGASVGVLTSGISALITAIVVGIGEGIAELCKVIIEIAPLIGEMLIVLVEMLCEVLVKCAPAIVETVLELILAILEACERFVPTIAGSIMRIITGVIAAIASEIPALTKAVVDLLFSLIVGVMDALGALDSSILLTAFLNISMVAAIFAELIAIGMMGLTFGGAAIAGLGFFVVAVVALAAVFGTLGALVDALPFDLAEKILALGDVMGAIGYVIGRLVGDFLGGLLEFATKAGEINLSNIAKAVVAITLLAGAAALIGFLTKTVGTANVLTGVGIFAIAMPILGLGLLGFSAAVAGVDTTQVANAALALTILAGVAAIIGIVAGMIGLPAAAGIAIFAVSMPLLGLGLLGFAAAVSGIDTDAVNAAAVALVILAGVAAAIGVVATLLGPFAAIGIAVFAVELVALGAALWGFSAEVDGMDVENVRAAAEAIKILSEASANLTSGGFLALFGGGNSIADFAEQLPELGGAIMGFAKSVEGLSAYNDDLYAAVDAAAALTGMAKNLPATGGIFELFTGKIDYASFKENMPQLAEAVNNFAANLGDLDPTKVTAGADAVAALAGVCNDIPTTGGMFAWAQAKPDFSGFKTAMSDLGGAAQEFHKSLGKVTAENISAGANAVKTLADAIANIPKDTSNVSKFGTAAENLGKKLQSFYTTASAITKESITNSKNAINAVKTVQNLKADAISSAAKAIGAAVASINSMKTIPSDVASKFNSAIKELGKASAEKLLSGFDTLSTDIKKKATSAMESFVKGIEDKLESVATASRSIVSTCVDAIEEKAGSFEGAAEDLVKGFANGISVNTYRAEAKARAMAAAAAEAARKELDEHSPSKVGYGIGDFFGIAFVNGISDNISKAYNSSSDMAASAKSGLSDAISKIGDAVNGDMDVQPTIRPVLDLSDVRAGAGAIGNLLGGQSVGVVGSISSMMNSRNQNGANDDVVSELNKLREDLSKIKSETYNINGVTYDDGSNIAAAVKDIVRAARIERRV